LPRRGHLAYDCNAKMNSSHPPIGLSERLDLILAGVREVAAARSGLLGPLIALLWRRLIRRGLRFAALLAAFRAGKLRASRPHAPGAPWSGQPRLPGGFGWLVRRCGWQAACYGSQLRQLLAEPEMVALLRASPQAVRMFRPLCRMLAIELPPALALKRQRGKPAAARDAASAQTRVSCHTRRALSVAAEAPTAAPEAPTTLVHSRSPPSAVRETRATLLWPRARTSLPREAVGRGVGPPR
jgi:hypothetical protein